MQDRGRNNRGRGEFDEEEQSEYSPDPPWREQLSTLWGERKWARAMRAKRVARIKIYGYYISAGTGLAVIASTIIGWFWKK